MRCIACDEPSVATQDFVLEEEQTQFSFAENYPCYAGENENTGKAGNPIGYVGSQESEYKPMHLADLPTDQVRIVPLLVKTPAANMDELLALAKEKNVRLWLWLHWSSVDRNDAYREAFPVYEKWGIAGVKIDFMNRDDQDMVNWYEKIAKAAAEHHLMVNFHGAFKPTGMIRTYPNQITREGILGNEYNRWSSRATPWPVSNRPRARRTGLAARLRGEGRIGRNMGDLR
jgi:hypothetical protein